MLDDFSSRDLFNLIHWENGQFVFDRIEQTAKLYHRPPSDFTAASDLLRQVLLRLLPEVEPFPPVDPNKMDSRRVRPVPEAWVTFACGIVAVIEASPLLRDHGFANEKDVEQTAERCLIALRPIGVNPMYGQFVLIALIDAQGRSLVETKHFEANAAPLPGDGEMVRFTERDDRRLDDEGPDELNMVRLIDAGRAMLADGLHAPAPSDSTPDPDAASVLYSHERLAELAARAEATRQACVEGGRRSGEARRGNNDYTLVSRTLARHFKETGKWCLSIERTADDLEKDPSTIRRWLQKGHVTAPRQPGT